MEQLQDLPLSTEGTSLLDLREAARRFGAVADVRKFAPADVARMPLPAIAQFKTSPNSLTPVHFNVIYKTDGTHIYLINGTTGFKETIRISRLPDFWTGYAMVQNKKSLLSIVQTSKPSWVFAALFGVVLVVYCCSLLPIQALRFQKKDH